MKFFLDHCVSNRVGTTLRMAGHEIIRLREVLPNDSPDPTVLHQAGELDAILVSLNGDFTDITAYPPSNHGGIIALQVRNRPETITAIMDRLLEYLRQHPEQQLLAGKLLLVEAHRIRLRT